MFAIYCYACTDYRLLNVSESISTSKQYILRNNSCYIVISLKIIVRRIIGLSLYSVLWKMKFALYYFIWFWFSNINSYFLYYSSAETLLTVGCYILRKKMAENKKVIITAMIVLNLIAVIVKPDFFS